MVLAFAIGIATYQETTSLSSHTWVRPTIGGILIVAAILTGLSLKLPGLGRWFLGRMWPGRFSDGKQKHRATGLVFGLLLAYLMWGSGTLLGSIAGSSPLWGRVESAMTILGALGACAILWAQAALVRQQGRE
jgi:hypothetical protein